MNRPPTADDLSVTEHMLAGALCRSGVHHPQLPIGSTVCGMCAELATFAVVALADQLLPEGAETRTDMLDHYSRALDEIFRLRRALAYEARAVEGVLNGYASLPRTARPKLAAQVERMREAARGEAGVAYADVAPWAWKGVLRQAGADVTLSRSQWESGDAVRLAVGDSKPTGQDPSVSVEETPQ